MPVEPGSSYTRSLKSHPIPEQVIDAKLRAVLISTRVGIVTCRLSIIFTLD